MLLNAVFMRVPIRQCFDGEKAGRKLAFWGAIFGSVDVGTRCRDPGTGEIL
jgi:hypothetical protein